MALKNLLGAMPSGALGIISDVLSAFGWEESCWTEDALASKRILPGYSFRVAQSKSWGTRQTVTKDSCILMMRRIQKEVDKNSLKAKLSEKILSDRA